MSKGKYAAKAANRAVALDNEVIAQLRADLEQARQQRDDLSRELDAVHRRMTGEVNRRVTEGIAADLAELNAQLDSERAAVESWKSELASEVVELLHTMFKALREQFGEDAPIIPAVVLTNPDSEHPSLLRVLGMLMGEDTPGLGLVYEYTLGTGNHPPAQVGQRRNLRRRSAAKLGRDIEFYHRISQLRGGQ